ncbi:MAG: hypothetical protein WCA96_15830 [Methylocella sp.]
MKFSTAGSFRANSVVIATNARGAVSAILTKAHGRTFHLKLQLARTGRALLADAACAKLAPPLQHRHGKGDQRRLWPVSKEVNVPGRGDDGASLIEPVEAISAGSLTRSIHPPKEHQEDDRYNDPYADHDTPPLFMASSLKRRPLKRLDFTNPVHAASGHDN